LNSGEPRVVRMPLGQRQILDRVRQAVHPATVFAACQFGVALVGLGQQVFRCLEADQCVDQRIEAFDMGKISLHHFPAGHLAQTNALGEFVGLQQDQFADVVRVHCKRPSRRLEKRPDMVSGR
jgi:hypothetical protein